MGDGRRFAVTVDSADEYHAMADDYAADTADGPDNAYYEAYYERPATISMLGDVSGRRVLEAGCGAGVPIAWLADYGATVTAFDLSDVMVALARSLVGDEARFLVVDLSEPLSFATEKASTSSSPRWSSTAGSSSSGSSSPSLSPRSRSATRTPTS